MLGRGVIEKKKCLAHALHNIVSMWLRRLVVLSMVSDAPITIDTEFEKKSLHKVLHKIHRNIAKNNLRAKFKSARACREFMKKLKPSFQVTHQNSLGKTIFPCGMTANDLTYGGRNDGESFRHYCNRMLKHGVWGGAGEAAVVAAVTGIPVEIHSKDGVSRFDSFENTKYTLQIFFDGIEHYDAIVLSRSDPVFVD